MATLNRGYMTMDILHKTTGVVLKTVDGANLEGADLVGANLEDATIDEHILTALAGRATRFDGYEFFAFRTQTGHVIRAGCRTMTLDEYRTHVVTEYPGGDKARRTLRLLNYLEAELSEA